MSDQYSSGVTSEAALRLSAPLLRGEVQAVPELQSAAAVHFADEAQAAHAPSPVDGKGAASVLPVLSWIQVADEPL